jgi:hypothetical protein
MADVERFLAARGRIGAGGTVIARTRRRDDRAAPRDAARRG